MIKDEKILFLDIFRMRVEVINNLKDKLATLVSSMQNCKAIDYSDMPKGGVGTDISDKISKKIELEKRIESLTEKIADVRSELIAQIDMICDVRIHKAMEMYYIDGLNKKDICQIIEKCDRQLNRYLEVGIELILND